MSLLFRSVLIGSTLALACGGSAPPPVGPAATSSSAPLAASGAPRLAASSTAIARQFSPSVPKYDFTDPDRKKKLTAAFPEVDAIVLQEMEEQHIPGAVVGIVIDGELAYAKGFGYSDVDKKKKPDQDTVFRIGSITKSFVGLAALALRDEGVIDFDDPLVKYIPEAAALVYPTHDSPPITLRHLLMHSSGLPRVNRAVLIDNPTDADMMKALQGFALENPPGTKFVYSNFGYSLLGIALGRAGRMSFHDVVQKWVIGPYGMKSTVWEQKEVPADRMASGYVSLEKGTLKPAPPMNLGADDPSGGIYSTVRDMSRYLSAQLAAYPARNEPDEAGVRRSSLREAHVSGVASMFSAVFSPSAKKGESLLVWHNGGLPGFSSDIRFLKDRGVAIVTFANLMPAEAASISVSVMRALRRSGGLSKRSVPPAPYVEPLMKKLLAIYNEWDEPTYKSLFSPKRPALLEIEKKELAGYKELHGTCKEYKFVEQPSPGEATFSLDCQRGPFEMKLYLLPQEGFLRGFGGLTRGLPVPKETRGPADKLVGLIRKWDPATYAKHLGKEKKTREKLAEEFDGLRLIHGACTVQSMTAFSDEKKLVLDCEHGGEVELTMELDKKDPTQIVAHAFNAKEGVCPVR
jgi:CubicO group peptidase (beta-lactamase class C family)